jgi:hypothetical protein
MEKMNVLALVVVIEGWPDVENPVLSTPDDVAAPPMPKTVALVSADALVQLTVILPEKFVVNGEHHASVVLPVPSVLEIALANVNPVAVTDVTAPLRCRHKSPHKPVQSQSSS